ncbi:hypothetical protein PanWU01x14_301710 [Parasponia andersonii]|uniref:Transmembrane protein n=1 Tax=Parasponia andersonii TaxID=3476 RepID=A0A2P5ATP6_PARAD|nr:hypothetical protein PanWU01x14_301710 [Parasponia andersonii]
MSLEAKKQRRGSNAPELLINTVERFPPSHEWLMNLAIFPILVASIFSLKHAFLDGRCSLTTRSAEENPPPDESLSYFCCRFLASLVVKSSPSKSKFKFKKISEICYAISAYEAKTRKAAFKSTERGNTHIK